MGFSETYIKKVEQFPLGYVDILVRFWLEGGVENGEGEEAGVEWEVPEDGIITSLNLRGMLRSVLNGNLFGSCQHRIGKNGNYFYDANGSAALLTIQAGTHQRVDINKEFYPDLPVFRGDRIQIGVSYSSKLPTTLRSGH